MNFNERLEKLHSTPDHALRLEVNNFYLQYKDRQDQDWYKDMLQFTYAMRHYVGAYPSIPPEHVQRLRRKLICEEVKELMDAIDDNDLEKIADSGGDSIVVILGTMIAYGIDLRPVWDEIWRTNMAKKDGPIREDGKRLKPEGWQPPDIKAILDKQKGFHT